MCWKNKLIQWIKIRKMRTLIDIKRTNLSQPYSDFFEILGSIKDCYYLKSYS